MMTSITLHAGVARPETQLTPPLRPYQVEALEAVDSALAKHRSTLVVMPTGTGKTVLFAAAAERYRSRGRVLVLAHREELITQARDKIEAFTPLRAGVEMAEQQIDSLFMPDVVVASVQTLGQKARREKFSPDAFALLVVDEAHHATAPSYRAILDYFAPARILGVTATPDRLDGTGMGEVFESAAYVYEIRAAIEQGYLVPIRQRSVSVAALDLSQVKVGRSGDFDEKDLERVLLDEAVLCEIAKPTLELADARPTILFAVGVAQARALADVLNQLRPGAATSIDGQLPREERAARIASFHAGRVQFLSNCAVLTEGFDAPATSCVAIARPTQSRALFAQMVGRGTRLHPASGKADVLVLDFKGNAGRHALVTAVDILDGNRDPNVRAQALAIVHNNPDKDVLTALTEADQTLAEKAREAELRARAAEAARAALATARARYQTTDIDPFTVLGASERPGRFGGLAPTERQTEALGRNGIELEGLDRGQASALLDRIMDRRRRGLCTFKMARQLARFGLNPDVSFEDAREAIDAIRGANWRAPAWLFTDPRFARTEAA